MKENKKLLSSFAWKFAERMLSQGIGLVLQIFIARLVVPEAIGQMVIILSVINIFSVISQSGFSSYIIQKQNIKEEVISTIATFSVIISILCIVIFLLFGNFFMNIIGYPNLGIYLKICSIVLIFNAINGICSGLLAREMEFKEMFMRTVVVLPIAVGVCFSCMFLGYDLEALLAYNIVNPFCTMIFLLILLHKKGYKIYFRIKKNILKQALPYSFRVLTQDIGSVLCNSIKSFFMGGIYSANALAYYDRAYTYTSYVEESITYTASSVLLPAMAKEQNDKEKFNNYIVNATAIYSLLVIPALIGFAAISPTFIKLILTEKWMPCIPYIWIFSIGFLHYPILTIHKPAFLATGRSDITLKITMIQNGISIFLLIITMKYSPILIAVGTSISLLVYIPLYINATRRYMEIPIKSQIWSMGKYILYSIIMGCIVYFINFMKISDIIKISFQICIGVSVYIFILFFLKDEFFIKILKILIKKIKEKRK